jgi:hypothetical protein
MNNSTECCQVLGVSEASVVNRNNRTAHHISNGVVGREYRGLLISHLLLESDNRRIHFVYREVKDDCIAALVSLESSS